ncbi:ATP-binding cassette domain-containing protein [Acetobacterium wieringae]|uniref:ATP-binding cassette domain-containing protein n=1 Tax=Acetobacterium wieringae TaxID=52694 RepID=A0A1F2PIZ4_9FIRM|nr:MULTISPECIES: ATP-binding cassette domain-containing protein [Acetobacterium]MEA4805941.1 ATP-binding cassette domain-containing protein [Acetobacterium wieringae]OFV71303.1 vegetative protein 296 [Acetobacterium wieringae]OXS25892.1 MAG: ABC transporter ATP-binding protein [Acetobacterium sp. MES1]UYO61747.1 ATP-binding cassette domain-containing protein [Acetobacterium wieringae]VUZ28155.1 Vegetative protein 296 [Acetobacterium wieringae]
MLKLENISFEVENEKEILRDVNLTIEKGKFIAITGPNGGGKSTLARIISGVLKPTKGKITFYGEDITDLSITERAQRGISFGFQQPVRFKGITVHDLINIAKGEELSVMDASHYLSEVGLCAKDYIHRELNDGLSGGEIKRIEIATIIARNTKLSIFDEPEAGIDLWSFNHLIDIFLKMHQSQENSIVIISHQERILDVADEIIAMVDGAIVKRGAKESVLPELLHCEDPKNCLNCHDILEA